MHHNASASIRSHVFLLARSYAVFHLLIVSIEFYVRSSSLQIVMLIPLKIFFQMNHCETLIVLCVMSDEAAACSSRLTSLSYKHRPHRVWRRLNFMFPQ